MDLKSILIKSVSLFLLAGSFLLSFFLLEVISFFLFKYFNPTDLKRLSKNLEYLTYPEQINLLGFREKELKPQMFEKNAVRLLFLGDSFTFGHGISKKEDRFSDLLESKLNSSQYFFPKKYFIYNAAVFGTEPEEWEGYLKKLLPLFKPHIVFAVFFLRDGAELCTSIDCQEKDISALFHQYEEKNWFKYLFSGKYLASILVCREFSDHYLEKLNKAYLGDNDETQFWKKQKRHLISMKQLTDREGIFFNLIIFPMLIGLERDYPFKTVENIILKFAHDNNMAVFSLLQGFLGQNSQSLWISRNDQHPNLRGHEIAADTLFTYILKTNPSAFFNLNLLNLK